MGGGVVYFFAYVKHLYRISIDTAWTCLNDKFCRRHHKNPNPASSPDSTIIGSGRSPAKGYRDVVVPSTVFLLSNTELDCMNFTYAWGIQILHTFLDHIESCSKLGPPRAPAFAVSFSAGGASAARMRLQHRYEPVAMGVRVFRVNALRQYRLA